MSKYLVVIDYRKKIAFKDKEFNSFVYGTHSYAKDAVDEANALIKSHPTLYKGRVAIVEVGGSE